MVKARTKKIRFHKQKEVDSNQPATSAPFDALAAEEELQNEVNLQVQLCSTPVPHVSTPLLDRGRPNESSGRGTTLTGWVTKVFDWFRAALGSCLPLALPSDRDNVPPTPPISPSPPPTPAPVLMTFEPRSAHALPPGFIAHAISNVRACPVQQHDSFGDQDDVPRLRSMQELSDAWSSAFDTLERAARAEAYATFAGMDGLPDPDDVRKTRALVAANLAQRVLCWLMDPAADSAFDERVVSKCGTPEEMRYEMEGTDADEEEHDYLAFAANKAVKTLKNALLVAPNLQLVVVRDQGQAQWDAKYMLSYHHDDPDRDPSSADSVKRWIWPGWRDPSSGNIIVKPKVYTACWLLPIEDCSVSVDVEFPPFVAVAS